MKNHKNPNMTIDDYVSRIGARWKDGSEELVLSSDGAGRYYVQAVDLGKRKNKEDSDDEDSSSNINGHVDQSSAHL